MGVVNMILEKAQVFRFLIVIQNNFIYIISNQKYLIWLQRKSYNKRISKPFLQKILAPKTLSFLLDTLPKFMQFSPYMLTLVREGQISEIFY